jgi:transposase, IS5 family
MKKKKKKNDRSFFDEDLKLNKLTKQGDPLERLKNIKWEIFRSTLENVTLQEDNGQGGKPPYDRVLMFKIVILQRLYNLSDEQSEYQINDRLTFMRFLNLNLCDDVPDARTIWLFKEKLACAGVGEKLFNKFKSQLDEKSLIVNEGSIIDASFVEVPKQRNNKDENDDIKNGKIPEEWEKEKNANKLSQKDTDARWTKKNNVSYYGYKDHVKVDSKSKLITKYEVTDASVHDSQVLGNLLDKNDKGKTIHADSAYTGQEETIKQKKVINQINEKGYKNKPLTDEQKKLNKIKSKTRVRVEHVFGFIENSMKGSFIRSIGKVRAELNIGLMNLTYNIFRYLFLTRA